jgi:hypothetical protein
MLIKRKNVVLLNKALYTLKDSYNYSFRYAIRINKEVLFPIMKQIRCRDRTAVEKFIEYETKLQVLVSEYAKRTPRGKMFVENNRCTIPTDQWDEYFKKETSLKDQYKEAINLREIEKKQLDEYLESEIDLDILQVREQCIPENISQSVYEALSPMIHEKPVKAP